MPGIFRYTVDKLSIILNKVKNKILLVALFPNTPSNKKDKFDRALNENNLVCRSIKYIKKLSINWCDV